MNNQQKTQTQTKSHQDSPKFHIKELLAKFSPQFTRNQQTNFLSNEVIIILSDPNWFISQKKYHDQNWQLIFPYILQSYCRRFFLVNTGFNGVIQQISNIKFSCLKQLDLGSNKITNIQAISFLKIPNIKNIILKNNFIVNINGIRKAKWKNLQFLDFEYNLLIEWKRINELYINPLSIQSFNIEFYSPQTIISMLDISQLYAKFRWNKKTTKIIKNLSFFNNQVREATLDRQANNNLIGLGQKKYEALIRKFL